MRSRHVLHVDFLLCCPLVFTDALSRARKPGKRALTIPCSNPQAGGGGGGRQSGPRLPKMPQMQDFQFFNTARLTEIYNKENAHEVHKHQQGQKEASLRSQVRLAVF